MPHADNPFFPKVAILGVGLLGGSLGLALKTRNLAGRVVGVGRDEAKLATAQELGAIDEASTHWKTGIADADVIVLCTSVGNIVETVAEIARKAKPGAVVTDVGSVKGKIVAASRNTRNFVGSHPMAGSEKTGVEAASANLFDGATWALTPTQNSDPVCVEKIVTLASSVGASPLILTPDAHDSIVAVTSHLPHVLASALMRRAATSQTLFSETSQMTAGSFADMTRIAASSSSLWRDISLANRDALLSSIAEFRADLDTFALALEDENADAIEAFFSEGATAKRDWNS